MADSKFVKFDNPLLDVNENIDFGSKIFNEKIYCDVKFIWLIDERIPFFLYQNNSRSNRNVSKYFLSTPDEYLNINKDCFSDLKIIYNETIKHLVDVANKVKKKFFA